MTSDHLTPELPLHLLTPSCRLYTAQAEVSPAEPWWTVYWPGGQVRGLVEQRLDTAQVLARYLLDNPALVRKKTVLDLGSGCGAVSLAAKR